MERDRPFGRADFAFVQTARTNAATPFLHHIHTAIVGCSYASFGMYIQPTTVLDVSRASQNLSLSFSVNCIYIHRYRFCAGFAYNSTTLALLLWRHLE